MSFYYQQKNNAVSLLEDGLTENGTTLTIQSGTQSRFPLATGGATFYCTIIDSESLVLKEIVLVTNTDGNLFYVQRAQQGTTSPPQGWAQGSIIALLVTAGDWNNFIQRDEYVNNTTIPIGGIMYWGSKYSSPPSRYLLCDGSPVSKTTYAALYAVVGNTWGSTGTTFNLPNLKGRYVRGWNNQATGYDAGRAFGSNQSYEIASHIHSGYPVYAVGSSENDTGIGNMFYSSYDNLHTTKNTGNVGNFADETRPYTVVLGAYIRATA